MIVKPDYCPEWFDITLYDGLKNYSRDNLMFALALRKMKYHSILNNLIKLEHEEREKYKTKALQELKILANDLLIFFINNQELKNLTDDIINTSIQEVTVSEIKEIYSKIKVLEANSFNIYDYLVDYFPINNSSTEEKQSVNDFLNSTVSEKLNIKSLFRIDLLQSDEMLKMAFDKKLKEIRAKEQDKEKRTKRFSDAEIKKIIEYRVLAYIDLYIFGKIIDRKFTDVEMAAMIYPPTNNTPLNFDAVDRIARTVRPKAIELLEKTNMRLLL